MAALGLHFCARAFSSCGEWGPLFIAVRGPLTVTASPVAEHRLQTRRLSSCGSRAQLLRGTWDLPRPGLEPVSPALAGGFLTTAPPGSPRSQITLRNCSKETGFSAQFYILSEQRTLNKAGIHFFKVSETKPDQHRHSESAWPWHLGKESYHQRSTSMGAPGREAFNLYFQYGHSLFLVNVPISLMIRADVQCMLDRPQIGCFS